MLRWLFLGLALLASTAASAQTPCCSAPPVQTAAACETADTCALVEDNIWVTLNGEYRVRGEALDPVNFGIGQAPGSDSLAHRALVGADLRTESGVRAYVQLSLAGETGRKPQARPFDESRVDLAQAFVEIPLRFGESNATLRLGRQELAIGNRLIGLRDGVTLRRAFEGARIDLRHTGSTVNAFYLRPIFNRPGTFDDGPVPGEHFAGLTWQFPGAPDHGIWTIYAFHRERDTASTVQASGHESRQSLGLRYARTTPRWDLTAQVTAQIGALEGRKIRAWGGAIDFGWKPEGANPPRFGIQIGLASGDRDQNDRQIGTFDPLYPNLGAFTDAALYYYANQFNIQTNVQKAFGQVTLRADVTLLGRLSGRDAIYVIPGRPLAVPPADARLSAVSFEASARWRVSANLEIYASILRAEALPGVRAVGGRDTNFGLLQVTTGF